MAKPVSNDEKAGSAGSGSVSMLTPEAAELRQIKVLATVRNFALISAAIGFIPIPFVDIALAAALQVRMIQQISQPYGVAFRGWQLTYGLGFGLVGAVGVPLLVGPLLLSALKFIPGVGTLAGMLTLPVVLLSVSYALGRMFVQHYEAGGVFLSFKPEQMRNLLKAYYDEGLRLGESKQAGLASR